MSGTKQWGLPWKQKLNSSLRIMLLSSRCNAAGDFFCLTPADLWFGLGNSTPFKQHAVGSRLSHCCNVCRAAIRAQPSEQ